MPPRDSQPDRHRKKRLSLGEGLRGKRELHLARWNRWPRWTSAGTRSDNSSIKPGSLEPPPVTRTRPTRAPRVCAV